MLTSLAIVRVLLNLDPAVATGADVTCLSSSASDPSAQARGVLVAFCFLAGRFLATLTAGSIMALLGMALSRKFSNPEILSRLMVLTPGGPQNIYAVAEGS